MRDRKMFILEIYKIKIFFINAMSVVTLLIIDNNFIETFNNL